MPGNSFQNFTPWAFYRHFINPPKARKININKSVLITGGNTGIGQETVFQLAKMGCKNVTICARNQVSANETIEKMTKFYDNLNMTDRPNFKFEKLDLSSQESCKNVADKFVKSDQRFDVFINNAGLIPSSVRKTTVDGHELCIATNHLGHHTFLLSYLNNIPVSSFPQRIVILASCAHANAGPYRNNGFYFKDPMYETNYNAQHQYSYSKLANILFMKKLAEKLPLLSPTTTVNAVHPGVVHSELFNRMLGVDNWFTNFAQKILFRSVYYGCQTTLQVGFSEEENGISGKYFENTVQSPGNLASYAKKKDEVDRLWDWTVGVTGVDLNMER